MRSKLDGFLTTLLIVLMSIMVLSTLLQVFARFIDANVPFTEELTIYAMMWVTLFGSAYAFGLKKHIAIDALVSIIDEDLKWKLEILIEVIVALFAILILIVGGGWFAFITFKLGQLSPVIQIPKGWIYLALPLSGLIILIYNVLNARAIILTKEVK
ncbi:MAG: TRAP transporter small permease subunit [Ekhidna sp.]|nr:TRAP transporter small permease subunit [Ekhidna sp.]